MTFFSEIDALFSPLDRPHLWLKSKNELQNRLMNYELKVRELEASVSALRYVADENAELKVALGTKLPTKKWITSTLLRSESQQLFVAVGASDDVNKFAIVLARGAYLGRVVQSWENLSRVISVYDPDSRVGVRVEGKGVGVLTGKGERLTLTTISRDDGIKVGDKVITVGDELVRQPGLFIGEIIKVLTKPSDSVSTFLVEPAFELRDVSLVMVSKGKQ